MCAFNYNEYVYVLEVENGECVLYAPLHQIVAKLQPEVAKVVQDILLKQSLLKVFLPENKFEEDVYREIFIKLGLDKLPEKWKRKILVGTREKSRVTLSLTDKCNLRCIYCSANTGNSAATMDWELAKKTIDVSIEHAKEHGNTCFEVKFHGGGEVFREYKLMKKCVAYIKQQALLHGFHPHLRAVSNVTLITEKVAKWLKENGFFITASVDGTADIQNQQRPYASGAGSFNSAMRGLKAMKKAGVPFEIRSTVTNLGVKNMSKFVQYVSENIFLGDAGRIHFEPLTICGRAEENELDSVNSDVFLEEYILAYDLGKKLGIDVVCSFDTISYLKERHCGTSHCTMFCVSPCGAVSSCSRITKPTDKGSEVFFYGQYNRDSKEFDIDPLKVEGVIKTASLPLEECLTCFARWHCQGHCPVARYEDDGYCNPACEMVKSLLMNRLRNVVA